MKLSIRSLVIFCIVLLTGLTLSIGIWGYIGFSQMKNPIVTLIAETGSENERAAQKWVTLIAILVPLGLITLITIGISFIRFVSRAEERKNFYEQILDAIPLPISVTDLDMKWSFINKAMEGMINVDRKSIQGRHCSEWKSDICGTERCGVAVLRKGYESSGFRNSGDNKYYRISVSYIRNRKNQKIGHVGIVADIDDQKSLEKVIHQVSNTVSQVASGASQVADSSQSLSQGATEQASSLEEITSSMTELNSQTTTNAENASEANRLAQETSELAEKGVSQMEEMMVSIGGIQEASNEIAKIIKVIDDIAFQTNLLALNAAVEAARAGKHGKGFAVVAQEVRNLASRSAKAAQQTSELISDTVNKIEQGTGNAETTVDSLIDIVEGIGKVTYLNAEIAAASNEQAQGIAQINQGLSQIEQVTQQNTANAEETASASEELSGMSAQLRQIIGDYNLKDRKKESDETLRQVEKAGAPKQLVQTTFGSDS